MKEILEALINEINRAKKIHTIPTFLALAEELGEAAKAAQDEGHDRYREELLQVACVAIRLIMRSREREALGLEVTS